MGGVISIDNNGVPQLPVNTYYAVLDTKTFEWYNGTEDVSAKAPYFGHTANIYNDYVFISFGNEVLKNIKDILSLYLS